jgi:CheY-like chemotaxis protein
MLQRILIVDDEEDTLAYLTVLLKDSGYETETARTGGEALEKVRSWKPDLVSLDITMPEQSGVRVFREMKDDPALAHIPILIVTGISKEFKTFISTRHKFPPPNGYLEKPITPEAMLAEVKRVLAGGDWQKAKPVRSA